MTSRSATVIRAGQPGDYDVLRGFERMYFPAVTGQYHAGYLFDEPRMAMLTLQDEVGGPLRLWTFVAEVDGAVVGYAAATPFRLSGGTDTDDHGMVLQYLAVDPAHRRSGIGSALISALEERALSARQNMLVAHVPSDQTGVYSANGWTVFPNGRGFAWLPFNDYLRADVPDPQLGFPLMAAKTLRPRAVRISFDFPMEHDAPTYDACAELASRINAGELDAGDLDDQTRWMLEQFRHGPKPPKTR